MTTNINKSASAQTYELGQARLKLRKELRFTLHRSGHRQWYLVEDEARGNYFRVNVTEFTFLSLLDGKRTLDEAVAKLASLPVCGDIEENKSASLARWVIESGLAETNASLSLERIGHAQSQEAFQQNLQWLNPISLRMPLFNPEPMVKHVYRYVRRAIGWPMAIVCFLVCSYGLLHLMMHWQEFWHRRVEAFSSIDLLWIAATWLILKVIHEFSHAITCKHFGGQVPQFGILWLLLIPLPYVDVSSSWRFPSKSQRILTAAAGMMSEALIAAIAILIWCNVSPGPLQYHAGNIFIAATLHTLMFNANPLMRFDGYYILIDWLEIPNLYTRGRQFVKATCKRWFFGIESTPVSESSVARTRFVKAYGVASFVWFVLICITLTLAAAGLIEGVGLLIAIVSTSLWLGVPCYMLARYLINGSDVEDPSRTRFALVTSGLVVGCLAIMFLVPSPTMVSAPVIVDYAPLKVVRAVAPGFVQSIHVRPGQKVQQNDLLVTLHSPKLVADAISVDADIQASRLRAQTYKTSGELATWQMEVETLESLQKQKQELDELLAHLQIRAPMGGTVVSRTIAERDDTYFNVGDEILSIGNPENKKAVAMVRQSDAVWLRENSQSVAKIQLWGKTGGCINGQIQSVNPRTTDSLPHDAFASYFGGPLAAVSRTSVESSKEKSILGTVSADQIQRSFTDQTESQGLKLVEPYVEVEIGIPNSNADELMAGQMGVAFVTARDSTLGSYLVDSIRSWLKGQVTRTHGM